MKKLGIAALVVATVVFSPISYGSDCKIDGYDTATLKSLKDNKFTVNDNDKRNELAIALTTCLGSADPDIRDGIAYGATSHWLRNSLLSVDTTIRLFQALTSTLASTNDDKHNFTQPFAALVLSEVVRVDRITPYLSELERQQVIDISTTYMKSIEDYRGFDDQLGWRHATAHTADIFLQLCAEQTNIEKAIRSNAHRH